MVARGDDHRGTSREGKPFGGGWTGPVLTHHALDTPVPDVTFVGDPDTAVAAGDKYVNVLGADVAARQ